MAVAERGRGRGMKVVDLYGRVRYSVQIEGLSRREAARQFGIDPRTVAKMLAFSVPPGYRRSRSPARPKLDPFTGIIDGILAQDEGRPRKQRHTSKRIFERLRDEHGYAGGITIVKDYVLARRQRQLEVFVPLRHDPGHAQADFGEALAEIAGVERKIHFFAVDLPHSDACFVQPYPAETTEAFCDGHNCEYAWNKDPVFGVIGIQSGPPGRGVHSGFHGGHGSWFGDAGSGDDRKDPSRVFRSEEADQGDLPRVSGIAEGRAQGDPIAGDRVSL